MSYKEQYTEAKKGKDVKALTAAYIEFKDKGVKVIGRLLARNSVQSTLGGGTYYQYLFDTDEGLVKFAMGRATDSEAGALMGRGGVYCIEFLGQEKISGGRKLNRFKVEEIEAPVAEVVGGASDLPF